RTTSAPRTASVFEVTHLTPRAFAMAAARSFLGLVATTWAAVVHFTARRPRTTAEPMLPQPTTARRLPMRGRGRSQVLTILAKGLRHSKRLARRPALRSGL